MRSFIRPPLCQLLAQRWYSLSTASQAHATITTPIYYVNAEPHIGHLYSSVLADTLARYHQLRGSTVTFMTGTDEHGTKIQQAAHRAETDPLVYCDRIAQRFKALAQQAHLSHTDFIRTTEPRHTAAVQAFWQRLEAAGVIYKGTYAGWYAISDEAFYAPDQVHSVLAADGSTQMVATETGAAVEWTEEENYKFRLGQFIAPLRHWLETHPDAIQPAGRRLDVLRYLKTHPTGPEGDLSVSRPRSRLAWGITVPQDPCHTVYVWLDALVNYLTCTGYPQATMGFPPTVQVVGKDILKFHAVFWPAFLLAAGLPLPQRIVAHAHWTLDNHKMSKSRGNVVDPFALLHTYGVDTVRFFLMRDGGLEYDADFSEARIVVRYKESLVDQLGNLVSRCAAKAFAPDFNTFHLTAAWIGRSPADLTAADNAMVACLDQVAHRAANAYEATNVRQAIAVVLEAVHRANKYVTHTEPWNLRKLAASGDDHAQQRLAMVLFLALETARIAGIVLQPIIPTKASQLLDAIGVPLHRRQWSDAQYGAGWRDDVDHNHLAAAHTKVIFPRTL
ncbi:methionyl-tRNA synthetase [Dimargaris verticillata]|uniref:Probable methionine--tRNA ligase, mitochondrial n=1 Tax=Dimargaris verticillata TaxID=2761393 RepID=A0A9W8BDH2_9FUNG|nr:methionyl-tRNA synthetase [Dimargaris verticillata]